MSQTLLFASGGHLIDHSAAVASARSLEHLPDEARRLFTHIEAMADSAFDGWPSRQRLMEQKADAETALFGYQERAAHAGNSDPAEVARLQAAVARADNALAAHDQKSAEPSAAGRAWRETRVSCLRVINSVAADRKKLEMVSVDVPKGASLDSLLRSLSDIEADIREAEVAPIPLALAIEQMRDRVDGLAARGAPRASVDVEIIGQHARARERSVLNLVWPRRFVDRDPDGSGDQMDAMTTLDIEALMAWAFRDEISDKLEADLESAYAGFDGVCLTYGERLARLRELQASRLLAQRRVCEFVWAAISAGDQNIVFPTGLDARAVLGVEVSNQA